MALMNFIRLYKFIFATGIMNLSRHYCENGCKPAANKFSTKMKLHVFDIVYFNIDFISDEFSNDITILFCMTSR